MTTTIGNDAREDLMANTSDLTVHTDDYRPIAARDEMHLTAVEEAFVADALWKLAIGILQIPPSQDHYFVPRQPGSSDNTDKPVRRPGTGKSIDKSSSKPNEDLSIIPLPHPLNQTYSLKWAIPTRIGGGAGVAYSLDIITSLGSKSPKARTRHLYITYMEEAGPSRCRTALASAIQQLGPILYTAEADATGCREADEELRARGVINTEEIWGESPLENMDEGTPISEDDPMDEESEIE